MSELIDTNALYNIGYGLYVITSNDGTKDNGMIGNTVIQVTSNPMQVVVCINKGNYSHDVIKQTCKMNVNCLSTEAPFSIFEKFGFSSGRDKNKFEGFKDYALDDNGVPYITVGSNAYFSGEVISHVKVEDHVIFMIKVNKAVHLNDVDSVTYDYYYKNIKPKPKQTTGTRVGWRCVVCGFVYEGEVLPPEYVCPLCKHGIKDFEKITY